MKLAYVIFWDAYRDSGVIKKAQAFVESVRLLGHECELFAVSTNPGGASPVISIPGARVLCHPWFRHCREQSLAALLARMATFPRLKRNLKDWNPDFIYYRLGLWMPGIVATLRAVAPYVIEVNTDNDKEAAHWDVLRRSLYSATKTFLPRSSSGVVSVSREIAGIYDRYHKPVFILSNGCAAEFTSRLLPAEVSFAFVGSPGQAWQGADKVVRLAARFPKWSFDVIGEAIETDLPNLRSHGYLNGEEVRRICGEAMIGIGTLALHRKGMEEASPLKVREYLQLGLPVIVGYDDTDLHGAPYCLRIVNTEDNVDEDADKIEAFACAVASGKFAVDPSDASARVSYVSKMKKLLGFLKELIP